MRLKARQLERAYPVTNRNVGTVLLREQYARPSINVADIIPGIAAMFMTLVVLVMLVACANIASLLLARVVSRGRDLAVRAAIGASQWRLVRQVLVECTLLAVLGGIGAIGVTYAATRAATSINVATDIPIRWGDRVERTHPRVHDPRDAARRTDRWPRPGIRGAQAQPSRRAAIRAPATLAIGRSPTTPLGARGRPDRDLGCGARLRWTLRAELGERDAHEPRLSYRSPADALYGASQPELRQRARTAVLSRSAQTMPPRCRV